MEGQNQRRRIDRHCAESVRCLHLADPRERVDPWQSDSRDHPPNPSSNELEVGADAHTVSAGATVGAHVCRLELHPVHHSSDRSRGGLVHGLHSEEVSAAIVVDIVIIIIVRIEMRSPSGAHHHLTIIILLVTSCILSNICISSASSVSGISI